MTIRGTNRIIHTCFSHDEDYRSFLSRIPRTLTVFEYLVGCWKRLNSTRATLLKKVRPCFTNNASHLIIVQGYPPSDLQGAIELMDAMRHLIISYIGINLMTPDAFPHPPGQVIFMREYVSRLDLILGKK